MAKELFEEAGALDRPFVRLGGGLPSGRTLVTRALSPRCKFHGVEPEAGNDGQRALGSSLAKAEIVYIATPLTTADGAQSQHLGEYIVLAPMLAAG